MTNDQGRAQSSSRLGRYELVSRLATGGMAEVWLAKASGAKGFQRTVVVKRVLPHLADNPEFVRMLINEAKLASALDHPNIVQIFDLGHAEGTFYIAMEHIAGRSLRQLLGALRSDGRVPPTWLVLHVVSSVCDALAYAHELRDAKGSPMGLVHRDLTPENIMVGSNGITKVLDFGIAKATTIASVTRAGRLKGKYAYMAPEQIEGIAANPQTDLYCLGVVLYECLTGLRPHRGHDASDLLRSILKREPVPPRYLAPWIPASLDQLIRKAIAKSPTVRYQSARQLQQAIDEHMAGSNMHPTRKHVAEIFSTIFGAEASSSNGHTEHDDTLARVSSASEPPSIGDQKRAIALFEEGLACMKRHDHNGALDAWSKAAQIDPDNRLYQTNLGMLHRLITRRP